MLAAALASILLLAARPSAAMTAAADTTARPDSADVARVETYDGALVISRIGKDRREFAVRVDSTVVYRDSIAQAVLLHTLTTWSGRRIAVIEVSSGGNACPSMFRIVEFSEERRPRVSPEIGNCSDLPVVMMDGARFRVRFPGFYLNYQARQPGFRPPPDATWEYLGDGRVRRLPATPNASTR
jgi:hypothetical protein